MSIRVKSGGSYADVQGVFVKQGGTYGAASVFAKVAGAYVSVGGGAAPALPPLDTLTAGAAYSTRLVRTAYTGPLLRVRRSSDNTEQDIGQVDGWLDEAALTTFVGANNGFVTTWYDQSGNSRHVANTTQADQPRIVSAGVIDKDGGKPTVVFDGTSDNLFNTSPFVYAAGGGGYGFVFRGVAQQNKAIFSEGSNLAGQPLMIAISRNVAPGSDFAIDIRNDANTRISDPTVSLLANQFDDQLRSIVVRDTGSSFQVFGSDADGSSTAYTRSGSLTLTRFTIGCLRRSIAENFFNGKISEAIFLTPPTSVLEAESLRDNQVSAYGVSINFP